MFKYNKEAFTVEDLERGLVVKQTGGAPELFVGEIVARDWVLGFLVNRIVEELEGPDSPQGRHVNLRISHYAPDGQFSSDSSPFDLAREAALALETGFYRTSPDRIRTNTADGKISR